MYKKCLKTYGYMLRYVFFVLGFVFLSILIGSSIAIKQDKKAISTMSTNIKAIISDADLSFDGVTSAVTKKFKETTREDYMEAIRKGGIANTTGNLVEEAVQGVIEQYTPYAEKVSDEIGIAVTKIMMGFVIIFILQTLAFIIGENAVAVLAGRDILKRSRTGILGSIVYRICRWIYLILLIGLVALALSFVPFIGILMILCYPIAASYLALLSRYKITVKDKQHFGKVVSAKNVFTLLAVNLTCIALSVVIALLAMAILGGLAAFYLLGSLLVITNATVRLNSYYFVDAAWIEEVPAVTVVEEPTIVEA